jgi:hypothetical protein
MTVLGSMNKLEGTQSSSLQPDQGKIMLIRSGLILSIILSSCNSKNINKHSGPLIIQQQGSFEAGGTVIKNSGVFDPIKHGAFNPSN